MYTATGSGALGLSTESDRNTANGGYALFFNNGQANTAVGFEALGADKFGYNNTAVGAYAGTGGEDIFTSTSGFGSRNTALGAYATTAGENIENSTALGYDAEVTSSNTIQLGNSSIASVRTFGSLTTGEVTFPNFAGTPGAVLGYDDNGQLTWLTNVQFTEEATATASSSASLVKKLEEQVAALESKLRSQQDELLAIVQSQQEQIAQLQGMVEHQFAVR